MKKEIKTKTLIYGGNFLAGFISRFGNFPGALIYSILDTLGIWSERVRTSKYTRLSKVIGGGIYAVSSLADILRFASNGDSDSLIQLPFDASMAYQLGKDAINSYNNRKVKGAIKDFREVINDGKGLIKKLK
jgi:hypothetical protein